MEILTTKQIINMIYENYAKDCELDEFDKQEWVRVKDIKNRLIEIRQISLNKNYPIECLALLDVLKNELSMKPKGETK